MIKIKSQLISVEELIKLFMEDRILHHCTVINIKGESYRLKDRKKNSFHADKEE